ncbi:hypothetical protein BDD12DRAFT_893672 [Trichophaea hybrida]|nr:hypothetical protein BDD12DRAFT_893672 [Trichophaea hybrida]
MPFDVASEKRLWNTDKVPEDASIVTFRDQCLQAAAAHPSPAVLTELEHQRKRFQFLASGSEIPSIPRDRLKEHFISSSQVLKELSEHASNTDNQKLETQLILGDILAEALNEIIYEMNRQPGILIESYGDLCSGINNEREAIARRTRIRIPRGSSLRTEDIVWLMGDLETKDNCSGMYPQSSKVD